MSYALRDTASLEFCLDYVAQVCAGLAALPELEPLTAPWLTMRGDLRAARDARDDARFALTAAQARVRVHDAVWDEALTELSGAAYQAAGKDAKRPPYVSLFGTVKAGDVVDLGAHKATVFGVEVIAKAEAQDHAALKEPVQKLKKAQDALLASGEQRVRAKAALGPHDIKRRELIDALEALIAATEIGILTAFPGRRDLVRAILSPSSGEGSRGKDREPAGDLVHEPA